MAALIAMCVLPKAFEPQECKGPDGAVIPWDWPPTVHKDREEAKFHASCLLHHMPNLNQVVRAHLNTINSWISQQAQKRSHPNI